MQRVAALLGEVLARLLGIRNDEWFAVMGGNWADLAANYYPPLDAEDGDDPVYNAAHRDLTVFTSCIRTRAGSAVSRSSRRTVRGTTSNRSRARTCSTSASC